MRIRRICLIVLAVLILLPVCQACAKEEGSRAGGDKARNKFGRSTPKPRTPGTIRVATYNVLNLFDHVDDPKLSGEHDDIDMATSDDRCRGIAAAILKIDADIIALEEMESEECLRWFRDTYLPDAGYQYLASVDVGYYRGVEQSVLSRFPITKVEVYPEYSLDDPEREGPGWSKVSREKLRDLRFQRSPLRVDIKISDEYELTLFALHHKSGGSNRWQREAEAIGVIDLVNRVREKDPARNLVILGDFNAAPWDKSLRVYLEAGFIDTLAHRVIPRWKDFDPTEPNLYKTHESGRVLDYILLNSAAHRELVIGSPQVLGTLYDEDYDWRKDPFPKGYAADHYPVAIDLIPTDQP